MRKKAAAIARKLYEKQEKADKDELLKQREYEEDISKDLEALEGKS